MLKRMLICLTLAFGVGLAALAEDAPGVNVQPLRGAVQTRAGSSAWTPLTNPGVLRGGAEVKTGPDGQAVMRFDGSVNMRLSPNSTAQVKGGQGGFVPLTNQGPPPIGVKLVGKMYVSAPKRAVQIQTNAAMVASPGSEFLVTASADRTVIRIVSGMVRVNGEVVYLSTQTRDKAVKSLVAGPGFEIIAILVPQAPVAAIAGGTATAGGVAALLTQGVGSADLASGLSQQAIQLSQNNASP